MQPLQRTSSPLAGARPVRSQPPVSVEAPAEPAEQWLGMDAAPAARRPVFAPSAAAPELQPASFPRQRYAIFGKKTREVPAEIQDVVKRPAQLTPSAFPSSRWVITPQIEANHRKLLTTTPANQLRDDPRADVARQVGGLLQRNYAGARNQTVVELGPATSTTVASAFSDPSNRYVGVDASEPFLEKQLEFLASDSLARSYGVKGDTYALPIQKGSADLVVTSCHPPFYSSSPEDRVAALDQVAQALKPGGRFLLFPLAEERQPPEFLARLAERFEITDRIAGEHPGRDALLLTLKA